MTKSTGFPGIRLLTLLVVFLIMLFGLNDSAQAKLLNNNLSGDLISAGDVDHFRMSPNGRTVVFVADANHDEVFELFSVPTTGGSRITLFTASAGDMYLLPQITPDGERVVFLVGASDRIFDIYAVPIEGGPFTLLFENARIDHGEFDITNDSRQVFFIESQSLPEYHQIIWRVPINGDIPVRITPEFCEDCRYEYQVSPDSEHIVYLETTSTLNTLFCSDLEGIRNLVSSSKILEFKISPDGNYIVYRQQAPDPEINLYAALMSGGPGQKLNGDLVDGGQVTRFVITPDSSKVVYRADQSIDEHFLLYAANIDDSDQWLLVTGLIPLGVNMGGAQITPNSQGVVFKAGPNSDGDNDLYIVSVFGGNPTKLNKELTDFDYISSVRITPNSLGVVYATMMESGQMELFAAIYTGTEIVETRLNADLPPGGSVSDFRISPNSTGVVFVADQEIDNVKNLYAVPIWGGIDPIQLNAPLISGGEVLGFCITPDSKGVVYHADQWVDGKWELFVTYDYQVVYLPLVVGGD